MKRYLKLDWKREIMPNMEVNSDIYCGDAADVLQDIEDDSIDLIVTSPPYADQRKDTYGGIPTDKYVEWFLPISRELLRVIKPSSFNGIKLCA